MNTCSHTRLTDPARSSSGGSTLVEVMVAAAVGIVVAMVSLGGMIQGLSLFKSNASEMIARDQGSKAIRKMSTDFQQAAKVSIYPNYLGTAGAAGQYGSCVVLQKAAGGSIAYYRAAPTSDPNSGGIYYCANTAVGPNPGTDKRLVSSVQELEFRRDLGGSVRAGFDVGLSGYPTRVVGGRETDRVRFTTSNIARNL